MSDLTLLYTPREWCVYVLASATEWQKELRPLLKPEETLISCGSSSEVAHNYYRRNGSVAGLFFFDTEQIFMFNDERTFGEAFLGRLAESWRDHLPGSLVFAVYRGIDKGSLTIGVSK
ncbi:MAG: hypothetical protein A3B96_00180 [Candidatus Spechtbacteria bacterium RIFCSPHIGHO2_02_FULL_43_15b]|nr:MAG: hypothetical protein A3B96_00180 [Candidatus Spechtbacteria bacterium RIFCSPHIGHO2_02_FULL_43_15b]